MTNTSSSSSIKGNETPSGMRGGDVVSFLIGALIGYAFFFGPTIQHYAPSIYAVSSPNHKGASK